MIEKIKSRLDDYLEFDSNRLFMDPLIRIFGGAIRDIISDEEIHDIDILCGPKSCHYLSGLLRENGYTLHDQLSTKDMISMYSNIKVINEPHTWMKGKKIVQLIRPVVKALNNIDDDYRRSIGLSEKRISLYQEGFIKLIKNVDISCCGVSYNGILYENFQGSISHCLYKIFTVNDLALMYDPKRICQRMSKLENRGWKHYNQNEFGYLRDFKIMELLSDVSFEYTKEYDVPLLPINKKTIKTRL